jgi:hypothetical protein
MCVVTDDDAFAFTRTAACKAAALTVRAFRIFFATRDFMGGSDIRATSSCRLPLGIGANHNEPQNQRSAVRGC